MGKDSIGDYILAATQNVRYQVEPTDREREVAAALAPSVRQVERNWIPILVREIATHDYLLIGSPIMLEAVRMAELDIVYCIQVGDDVETESQVVRARELMSFGEGGGGAGSAVDIMPLLKKVEESEWRLDKMEKAIAQIFAHVVPDETLQVNLEDERSLRVKLSLVPGIGEATLPKVIREILKNRPFYSEIELKAGVSIFKPPKKPSKSKLPQHERLWRDLKHIYVLDFSVKLDS